LKATDNYVEKYLPFEIQKIVSKNLGAILLKPPNDEIDQDTGTITRAPDKSTWTDVQKSNYEMYERFKFNEYDMFK